jgi:hypothetical protein
MTKDQKVIRAKVGLLELAKQLGNVSKPQAQHHRCPRQGFFDVKEGGGLDLPSRERKLQAGGPDSDGGMAQIAAAN